ncbi:hypothetical protein BROUX41_006647 [Berkeleyomyces rouxiae]|uniref:uncharacterized protein n=1 Tax=Berkeleyomyces rouxiae TaxID=2035830 RepID=UPI003B7E9448
MRATQMFIVAPVMAGLAVATSAATTEGCDADKGENSYGGSVSKPNGPSIPSTTTASFAVGQTPSVTLSNSGSYATGATLKTEGSGSKGSNPKGSGFEDCDCDGDESSGSQPKKPSSGAKTTPSVNVGSAPSIAPGNEASYGSNNGPSKPEGSVPKAPEGSDSKKPSASTTSTSASVVVGTAPSITPGASGSYGSGNAPTPPKSSDGNFGNKDIQNKGSDNNSHDEDSDDEDSDDKDGKASTSSKADKVSSVTGGNGGSYGSTDIPKIPEVPKVPGHEGSESSTSASFAVGTAPSITLKPTGSTNAPSITPGIGGSYDSTDAPKVPKVPGHEDSESSTSARFAVGSAPSTTLKPTGSQPTDVVPSGFATSVTSAFGGDKSSYGNDVVNGFKSGAWTKFGSGSGAVPTSIPGSSYGFNLGNKGDVNNNGLGDIVATIDEILSDAAETLGTVFYGIGSRLESDCKEKDCWDNGHCSFVDYDLPAGIDGTASVAGDIWNKGSNCGGCVEVKHEGQTYTLMVTNEASSADNATQLELTPKTWDLFTTSPDTHVVSGLKWNWVACPIEEEPLWVRLHAEANKHWFAATIENGRERTAKMEVSADSGKTWVDCSVNDYNLHVLDESLDVESVYVRCTSITGKIVTVPDVSIAGSKVAKAKDNYF